jgi:hypothetical protein
MPLMSAAKLSGIISRPGPTPVLFEMRTTTGMKIAVIRIAEARQRLTHGEYASEGQRREHDQRDGVQTGLVDRKHQNRRRKQS